MHFNDLIEAWRISQDSTVADPKADAALWDTMAPNFGDYAIPTASDDAFLSLLDTSGILKDVQNALDIGCGAGKYALALADELPGGITGTDLSPQMIKLALEKAAQFRKTNLTFRQENWHTLSLSQERMDAAFDLVYAHNTPAIGSRESLDKMIAAARKWCVLTMPLRRRDSILDALADDFSLSKTNERRELNFLYIFEYLWYKGYEPCLAYDKQQWDTSRPLAKACDLYLKRIRSMEMTFSESEAAIRHWLKKHSVNDIVSEHTETTVVTLYWRV